MNHLRGISAALALLAAVMLPAGLCAADSEGPSLTSAMKADYFVVHHDPSHTYLAELVADTAQQELARISDDLGYTLDKSNPFPLYVYPTHYSFITAGGSKIHKYTVGTARLEDQGISVDASGAFVSTRRVLAHEITHAVMFRILGQYATRLPLWAHEGTAKYESEKFTDTDKALIGEAAANGTLIPLRDLQERFPKDRSGLAYAQSASAIRFLIETYGEDSLGKLFEELAQTGSFESAMISATAMNPDEFADAWLENVAEHYRMVRLAKIAAGIGGGVMSLLVVIAFFVRRRQKTEAAQRWEAEEWKTDDFEEALRRQRGNDWWR